MLNNFYYASSLTERTREGGLLTIPIPHFFFSFHFRPLDFQSVFITRVVKFLSAYE